MNRLLLSFAFLAFAAPTFAADDKGPLDQEFVAAAAECSHCENQLASLAGKRSSRADVKEFAKTLMADYRAMGKDLAKIAKRGHRRRRGQGEQGEGGEGTRSQGRGVRPSISQRDYRRPREGYRGV